MMKNAEGILGAAGLFLAALLLGVAGVSTSAGSPVMLGGVTLEEVKPRVITPNGDSRNDVVFFQFDTSVAGLPIEADIRDIHGARVAGLGLNAAEDALVWDGKDDSGRTTPSGIYIYSIKIGQNHATGTVVVAR
jgi:hypothetical protein